MGISRLENLVINFIDDNVNGLEHHVSDIKPYSFAEDTLWWEIGGEPLFIANFDVHATTFGIRVRLFNLVSNIFSFSTDETYVYFDSWIKIRLSIESTIFYLF